MKKLSLLLIAIAMLSMSICANAVENNEISVVSETSSISVCEPVLEDVSSVFEGSVEQGNNVECSGPIVLGSNQMNANGNYDDKYYANYSYWCERYERLVELYLGITENPLDPERKTAINPKRTEPWWDEWIAEMLSEGLIEQSWYDEMIAKGYIIEVD